MKIFGLRWQSEAATPLFRRLTGISKRRGASLPAAVQNGSLAAQAALRSSRLRGSFGASVWFFLLVVSSFRVECATATVAKSPDRPNLIFILADDLGWRDTSLYGSRFYETPNLERLARRGMMFLNAYAANPLCSPTRASILTGLYPARLGLTSADGHLPDVHLESTPTMTPTPCLKTLRIYSATRLATNHFTLARALKQAGYATGHFGKWHLGAEPYSPLQQGFDVDVPHYSGPGPAGSYVAPWKYPAELKFTGQPGEHIEDRMAEEAIQFIKANKDCPFHLNYWAFSVHGPWDAKPELIEKYRKKAEAVGADTPQRNPVYGAMVQSLDENVGKLLNTLDMLGIARRTIIIFFSDNGGLHLRTMRRPGATPHTAYQDIPITSNAPLRGGKATLYEGGTRVPCVVVWPGKVKPGSTNDALFSSLDFYPTLLEMLGLKSSPGQTFDGVSQVRALLGRGRPRDTVFCHFPHFSQLGPEAECFEVPGTWVRRGDWKLIRRYCDNEDQTDRFELYNLKDDLGETTNLAATMPDKVKELNVLIDGFLQDTKALIPKPNPNYLSAQMRSGLTVNDGVLLRHGKPYRGIGVNIFDAFYRTLKDANQTNYDRAFQTLAERDIPFARFCGGGEWAGEMKLFVTNRAEYFRRFDGVIRSAEKHGVGLIPSFFWHQFTVPDLVGEPCDQWGNPQSRTHAFMREYAREVVSRYKNSPALWAWEFGNEFNLVANLPNAKEHRPQVAPNLGTPAQRTARDELTYEMIRTAHAEFGREVRRHDPYRVVLTGDSIQRDSAWHNWKENNWTKDTPAQFAEMLAAGNPDPINAISIHVYGEAAPRLTNALAVARNLKMPLFVGEFGAKGPRARSESEFRRLLAAIETNGVPLAAVWVFDFQPQDTDWNITMTNDRSYQLTAVAEANRRLQAAAGKR
jgi:arylsulfatase A-like enzyme